MVDHATLAASGNGRPMTAAIATGGLRQNKAVHRAEEKARYLSAMRGLHYRTR
jgi:hypothetical protein